MRRVFRAIVFLFLLFNFTTDYIFACNLQLTPSSFSVKPGGTVNFHLERTRTADQCPQSPETTSITITGGDLTEPGSWVTGNNDALDFKVKFNGTDSPAVNVTFTCNVTGTVAAEAKGIINNITTSPSPGSPQKSPNANNNATSPVPTDTTALTPINPWESGTGKDDSLKNPTSTPDTFAMLINQISLFWTTSPLGVKLWYLFLFTGLIFYCLKLKKLRKPLLFLSIIVLGFLMNDFANPNPVIFHLLTKKINYLTILPFLLIPVIISLFLGRFFCGWVCPVGAVQEFMSPDEKKRLLPASVDRVLKYLKYLLLIFLIYFLFVNHRELWSSYDPFKTFFSFKGTLASIIILVAVLLLSLFIERPFCRYICPMGAILSLTSLMAPFKMRTDADKCMVCGRCTAGECPMDAISAYNPEVDLPTVSKAECIYCFRCQKLCRKKSLQVTGFRIDHVGSMVGKSEEK